MTPSSTCSTVPGTVLPDDEELRFTPVYRNGTGSMAGFILRLQILEARRLGIYLKN